MFHSPLLPEYGKREIKLSFMEKIFTRIFPLALLLLSSCIKGEPRNTEADIVRCILPADILKSEPTIDDNSVQA